MFTFALPAIFFLFPLPWLVHVSLRQTQPPGTSALKVPFFNRILQLTQQQSELLGNGKLHKLLALLAWILLLIAASGPQWLADPIALPQKGRDIMIAVDLSGSMRLNDMQLHNRRVDRLTMVKSVANKFIQQRRGDRLGLILFGSKAYLQTPLTFDNKTISNMLDDASIGLAGQQTALGDSIALAVKRLMKVPQKNRVLILLTDGRNNTGVFSPKEAANIAKKNHVKIYTIGLGANQLIVPGVFGARVVNPSANLDEKTLQNIAHITGGLFFRAKNTENLQKIYQIIDKLEPIKHNKAFYRPITSYYHWPLALAMLISLYLALSRFTSFRLIRLRQRYDNN